MRPVLILLATLLVAPLAGAAVVGEEVVYTSGDTELHGFIAHDEAVRGKRPGVLVVHEWWGHNDYARDRARQLAGLGYVALAVDMYGQGRRADHPEDAGKFAGEVKANMAAAEARFRAAMQRLQEHPLVREDDIAAIGYCFGGGMVLEMARRGLPLDAVASFHGSLGSDNPAGPGEIQAEILVANGGADPFVKLEQIQAFVAEMEQAGAAYTYVSYPGVKHSFTNPGADEMGEKFDLPLVYDAHADRDSWEKMKALLAGAFAR
ncbi:dienelactone hydrolase family protein [Thiohalobacter thiocyanaticus]|uniref:Dienelactone hydrolase family protein n=1 Tax=Thiohalobacter thiocyanaticus TaxID=585455 RepID=A0A426QLZ9_9GAMM|nr:dienelactone hydrolase family protein [Thiohalobacter thiocyanaticus]RRQ22794.1 dienelactone hydrolase family protein [Thiohalobacter thiocyanaticus]